MSTLIVDACPCTYDGGFVQILISSLAKSNLYRAESEIKNVADVATEVAKAQAALADKDVYISVRIKSGRKPAGFDKWCAANRRALYLRAPAKIEHDPLGMIAGLEAIAASRDEEEIEPLTDTDAFYERSERS